jgi:hypothetical protein
VIITSDEIGLILESLSITPQRIAEASRNLEGARLYFKPDKNSWSANDILAHLRSCADVWGKSILTMSAQDHPTLRYISPRTWIKKTSYPELEFHQSLEAFTKQRNELVGFLKTRDLEDWSRGATFTATTRGREQTILSYVQRMLKHENEHCEQIEVLGASI